MDFLDDLAGDSRLLPWLIAFVLAAVTWLLLRTLRREVVTRLRRLADVTATLWDDILAATVERTGAPFLLALALFAGAQVLPLAPTAVRVARAIVLLASIAQAGVWASVAARAALEHHRKRKELVDQGAATMLAALGFLAQALIWTAVLLVALGTLGVDITALIAGLGVGGIAIALALQRILGDLFSSLAIVLDRPFVLRDFIVVGEVQGTVERIGLKTTRVRALSGEEISVSNSDLLESRIRNFGRLRERRVLFRLGVTYRTPREQLAAIPVMIRAAIEAQQLVRFDRCHFVEHGDSALLFEAVYYVLSPDYNRHLDIRQAINLAIHASFAEASIHFAYPTREVHLVGD